MLSRCPLVCPGLTYFPMPQLLVAQVSLTFYPGLPYCFSRPPLFFSGHPSPFRCPLAFLQVCLIFSLCLSRFPYRTHQLVRPWMFCRLLLCSSFLMGCLSPNFLRMAARIFFAAVMACFSRNFKYMNLVLPTHRKTDKGINV